MEQPKYYLLSIEKSYHAFLSICNVHVSLLKRKIGSAISEKFEMNL